MRSHDHLSRTNSFRSKHSTLAPRIFQILKIFQIFYFQEASLQIFPLGTNIFGVMNEKLQDGYN